MPTRIAVPSNKEREFGVVLTAGMHNACGASDTCGGRRWLEQRGRAALLPLGRRGRLEQPLDLGHQRMLAAHGLKFRVAAVLGQKEFRLAPG
jgi:hypothetical protein